MKNNWFEESFFYHIYPLGFCGAPEKNDYSLQPEQRLNKIYQWIPSIKELGVNALYLGPIFQSESHGYDTVDYLKTDRRLGDNNSLKDLIIYLHKKNIRVVLDGVFHHVSRDFFAFRDLLEKGENSDFKDWFSGIDFTRNSLYNDPFYYEGWNGYYNLVKLNLTNSKVKDYLFNAIRIWINEFDIDGLRLDVADALNKDFIKDLSVLTKELKENFWLMGEVIHGDYREWANSEMLDSTTNYECYKGLYSSHNDGNYFEIAYSLNRLFDKNKGIYRHLKLYNFTDNHDVNRVASVLNKPAHLYPLYLLLFTMPGIPSVYYGSEWGIEGERDPYSDLVLRPHLDLDQMPKEKHSDLRKAIMKFNKMRESSPSLIFGKYSQLFVSSKQFSFIRYMDNISDKGYEKGIGEKIIVIVNSSDKPQRVRFLYPYQENSFIDLLNGGTFSKGQDNHLDLEIPSCWGRILKAK